MAEIFSPPPMLNASPVGPCWNAATVASTQSST